MQNEAGFGRKSLVNVSYDLEFDPGQYTECPCPKYDLIGVIAHEGGLTFGYYSCLVRNSQGQWHRISDAHVEAVSPSKAQQSGACVLLYQSRGKKCIN
jgi:ubiquitin C-terminal hydrolase